ncbi:MAG TPA: hypothetical protein VFE47_15900 [Tepidisphaeraceae bacterium]|jgi:hypothetical protein|nr:hypothetical protein [Tepidisphaeraceae bacterium]
MSKEDEIVKAIYRFEQNNIGSDIGMDTGDLMSVVGMSTKPKEFWQIVNSLKETQTIKINDHGQINLTDAGNMLGSG